MTIITTIVAIILIIGGVIYGIMGLIASGMNAEVSNKVRFIDFVPALVLIASGIGLLIWF